MAFFIYNRILINFIFLILLDIYYCGIIFIEGRSVISILFIYIHLDTKEVII